MTIDEARKFWALPSGRRMAIATKSGFFVNEYAVSTATANRHASADAQSRGIAELLDSGLLEMASDR